MKRFPSDTQVGDVTRTSATAPLSEGGTSGAPRTDSMSMLLVG